MRCVVELNFLLATFVLDSRFLVFELTSRLIA